MDITVEAIEALRVPDGFTPVVGFRRFGIPWPPRGPEHYLVQKGHRWMPQEPTMAECRRAGSSAHVRARRRKQPLAKTRLLSLGQYGRKERSLNFENFACQTGVRLHPVAGYLYSLGYLGDCL